MTVGLQATVYWEWLATRLAEHEHHVRVAHAVVLLSDVHMQPLVALTGSPALADKGSDSLFGTIDEAVARARDILAPPALHEPRERRTIDRLTNSLPRRNPLCNPRA